MEIEIGPEGQRIYVLKEQPDVYPNAAAPEIPDDPGVAFIEALDLVNRTMLKHPNHHAVAAAFTQDDRDELRAGTPIFQAAAWMDLIQRWVSEAKGGP